MSNDKPIFMTNDKVPTIESWKIDGSETYPDWAKGRVYYAIPHIDNDGIPFDFDDLTLHLILKKDNGELAYPIGDYLVKNFDDDIFGCPAETAEEFFKIKMEVK